MTGENRTRIPRATTLCLSHSATATPQQSKRCRDCTRRRRDPAGPVRGRVQGGMVAGTDWLPSGALPGSTRPTLQTWISPRYRPYMEPRAGIEPASADYKTALTVRSTGRKGFVGHRQGPGHGGAPSQCRPDSNRHEHGGPDRPRTGNFLDTNQAFSHSNSGPENLPAREVSRPSGHQTVVFFPNGKMEALTGLEPAPCSLTRRVHLPLDAPGPP